MKTLQIISFFLIVLVLFAGCDKDDDYTPQPLPYFYCKINGQNFAARGAWQCQSQRFNFFPNGYLGSPPDFLTFVGVDCSNYNVVGIRINGFNSNILNIDMVDTTHIDSCTPYFSTFSEVTGNQILFDSILSGYLNFDQFSDKQGNQNGIVSGTFSFTVKNNDLDSILDITDGRFQYIIYYEWY